MKVFLITILSVLGVVIAASVVLGIYMYRFAVVRREDKNFWETPIPPLKGFTDEENRMINDGREFILSHDIELVETRSHDGLKLVGHYIENKDPRGIFLMVHGYRSSSILDFSCAVKTMLDFGFSCLIIDQRAHGYSEGRHIGFGALEKHDLVKWTEYALERFGELPVVLDGVSMGASTIMLGAEIGYPPNVRAMICDCGYTSSGAICKRVLKKWFGLPPFPIYYLANIFVRIFAGYSLDKVSAVDALKNRKNKDIPILIAHGMADSFVPYEMAEENFASLEGSELCELFSSATADHGLAFLRDKDGYIAAIERLFHKAGI